MIELFNSVYSIIYDHSETLTYVMSCRKQSLRMNSFNHSFGIIFQSASSIHLHYSFEYVSIHLARFIYSLTTQFDEINLKVLGMNWHVHRVVK